VLDLHLARAFELLADLVTAPAFESSEIEKERNVILEEIKMVEDTPDDLVFEIFSEHFYPRHPLGRSILGTPLTLARFKRRQVQQYYDRVYRGENLVIAAAGNIDHGAILELARKHFGSLPPRGERREESAPKPVPGRPAPRCSARTATWRIC
jgi:predicted Zn-dependent peptidase